MQQVLLENLLLAMTGAIAGALLAQVLTRVLVSFLATHSDQAFLDLSFDWRVLAFTTGIAMLTCLLFGLAPALRATGTSPATAMKAGGRGASADRSHFGARRILVVTQVALSLSSWLAHFSSCALFKICYRLTRAFPAECSPSTSTLVQ